MATRNIAAAPVRSAEITAPGGGLDGLRVALFSGNYNCVVDGANRALNRLTTHALSRGLGMRIYSPTIANPAMCPAGDLVSVPSFPIPGRPEYQLAPRLPGSIARDVQSFRPDVVHVSAPDGLGMGAVRLARRMGVPVVASMHTRFETYLEFYRLGFLRGIAEAWLRRFYNQCDVLLVPNEVIAQQLRAIGVGTPTRLWARGVDRAQFNPSRRSLSWRRMHGIADHEIVLLFFGRLVLEKGLAVFAEADSELRRAGVPFRTLIIGEGPERRRLERTLPHAHFTGHLDGDRLAQAVASADILVNPSLTEAFGNVTLEAMACGVVPVAADVPVNRLLIEDRRTGLLVEGSAPSAYARAVRELSAAPASLRMMARAAAGSADDFRWDDMLDAVIVTYAEAKRPSGAMRPAFLEWR